MNILTILVIIQIIALAVIIPIHLHRSHNTNQKPVEIKNEKPITQQTNQTNYQAAYKKEYLLTINEKQQYWNLRKWADSNNLIVFTKVRLADLISPRDNRNQSLFWKIQAKHVDFVICDQYINVKCIIELQDRSHYKPERIERDKFVREVLTSCGYKVIQTFVIQLDVLDRVCGFDTKKENPPCSV